MKGRRVFPNGEWRAVPLETGFHPRGKIHTFRNSVCPQPGRAELERMIAFRKPTAQDVTFEIKTVFRL